MHQRPRRPLRQVPCPTRCRDPRRRLRRSAVTRRRHPRERNPNSVRRRADSRPSTSAGLVRNVRALQAQPRPAARPHRGIAAGSAKPAKPIGKAVATAGGGNDLVWVNTQTHVYHKQGSRYYGKTKQGKYLSEQDAMSEGDRPAAKGE